MEGRKEGNGREEGGREGRKTRRKEVRRKGERKEVFFSLNFLFFLISNASHTGTHGTCLSTPLWLDVKLFPTFYY
jgi:hypothetical protein